MAPTERCQGALKKKQAFRFCQAGIVAGWNHISKYELQSLEWDPESREPPWFTERIALVVQPADWECESHESTREYGDPQRIRESALRDT
mmetsp:Transcript_28332/g.43909  ORF Transcript_28332/g.43909 Transcript_28332/m.43909 type:complete len:90 (+) Transcript_28332:122-391(+)